MIALLPLRNTQLRIDHIFFYSHVGVGIVSIKLVIISNLPS